MPLSAILSFLMTTVDLVALTAGILGLLTGGISLLTLIFSVGRRVGNVETRLGTVESNEVDKVEFGKLTNKVDTLYQAYVLEALPKRDRE